LLRYARNDKQAFFLSLRGTQWRSNLIFLSLRGAQWRSNLIVCNKRDCFAMLAMTSRRFSCHCEKRSDETISFFCHCEERSDEAISLYAIKGIASLRSQWQAGVFPVIARNAATKQSHFPVIARNAATKQSHFPVIARSAVTKQSHCMQ
jgi:hypothetical protein